VKITGSVLYAKKLPLEIWPFAQYATSGHVKNLQEFGVARNKLKYRFCVLIVL
jgi:hypothetical protein